jgi:hypothetical protein
MILPLEWTIKTCLIAATAFGISLSLRRFSAAIRHLVWAAAFCIIILLPLCSVLIPSSLHSNLPFPITKVVTPPERHYSGPIGSADSFALRAPSVLAAIVSLPWPALIWLVGCLASAAILVAGSLRLAWTSHVSTHFLDPRWTRASSELSRAFGLKRPVRLLQGSSASMPVAWGLLRPRLRKTGVTNTYELC